MNRSVQNLIGLACLLFSAFCCSGTLFLDDFESTAAAWQFSSGGRDAINGYRGNHTLRLVNVWVQARSAMTLEPGSVYFPLFDLPPSNHADRPEQKDLPAGFLLEEAEIKQPFRMSAFQPRAETQEPDFELLGQLSFGGPGHPLQMQRLKDSFGYLGNGAEAFASLPEFQVDLVQFGDRLLPAQRGSQPSDHPKWELILEPGRIWQEKNDAGWARVSMPFALQERNANCIHNGMLSFLVRSSGEISRLAVQIGSETCRYFQFDLWGVIPASFVLTQENDNANEVRQAYDREMAQRLPLQPLRALAFEQTIELQRFGSVQEVAPADMSQFGVVVNGVHYVGGCQTRQGPYPFCDRLVLPGYSTSKSTLGALGLIALAEEYPSVVAEKVSDWVPACAREGNWEDVTFADLLNMTTGHYDSAIYMQDEYAPHISRLFDAETHTDKITYSCEYFPRRTDPGEKFVYHTSDTYLLGTAMNAFLRAKKADPQVDFFSDLLLPGVWEPLGLSPTSKVIRRTMDQAQQPFAGWGTVFHGSDIAKISHALASSDDTDWGIAAFDSPLLDTALQRNGASRGMPATEPPVWYNLGFWAFDLSENSVCEQAMLLPFMSGYGGISVLLFPGGDVYYQFSDGGSYRWGESAATMQSMKPFCPEKAGVDE